MQTGISGNHSFPGDAEGRGWEAQLITWWQRTPELSANAPHLSERLVSMARRCAGLDMFRLGHLARIEWAESKGVDGFDDLKAIYHSLSQIANRAPQRFVEARGETVGGSLAPFFEPVPEHSKEHSAISDTVGDFLITCLERSPENSRTLAAQCRELVDRVSHCWRELAAIVVPGDGALAAETDPAAAIRWEAEELLRKVKEAGADLAEGASRQALIEQVTKVGGFLRLQLEPLFFETSEIDEPTAAAEFWQEAGRIARSTGIGELTAAAQILERDLAMFVRMLDVLEGIGQRP